MTKKMKQELIKELMADASEYKIGQRLRAVAYTVLSIAAYAYTAGLMAGDKWAAFVDWYNNNWIGNVEASETYPVRAERTLEEPTTVLNTIEGVNTPEECLEPAQTIVEELSETILQPKKQRRKAIGFAN